MLVPENGLVQRDVRGTARTCSHDHLFIHIAIRLDDPTEMLVFGDNANILGDIASDRNGDSGVAREKQPRFLRLHSVVHNSFRLPLLEIDTKPVPLANSDNDGDCCREQLQHYSKAILNYSAIGELEVQKSIVDETQNGPFDKPSGGLRKRSWYFTTGVTRQ